MLKIQVTIDDDGKVRVGNDQSLSNLHVGAILLDVVKTIILATAPVRETPQNPESGLVVPGPRKVRT